MFQDLIIQVTTIAYDVAVNTRLPTLEQEIELMREAMKFY